MNTQQDTYGRVYLDGTAEADVEAMSLPVRCRFCNGIYDLGSVTVTGRYVDCSVWQTPCCNRTADDRGDTGWKSFGDYEHLGRRRGRSPFL
jgi:hypothetical protein